MQVPSVEALVKNDESVRVSELASYHVLDTPPEPAFDDATLLATHLCQAPMAMVTLVDRTREWFKSKIGIQVPELPRFVSFCSRAIESPGEVMVIPDARTDIRFAGNPLVTNDPWIRFYAGAPLVTSTGQALGTVCVMDVVPRTLTPQQINALRALARQVIAQLDLRRRVYDLQATGRHLRLSHRELQQREDQLERTNARLRDLSYTDALTAIPNRRAFEEYLRDAIAQAENRSEPLSLVMLDVDRFKRINDEFGHPEGDEVLKAVARRLQDSIRKGDFVARFGGEEFVVVCLGSTEDQSRAAAERHRVAIREIQCGDRSVTASAGVAALNIEALSGEELVAAADRALYCAKSSGRDQVVTYSSMRARSAARS